MLQLPPQFDGQQKIIPIAPDSLSLAIHKSDNSHETNALAISLRNSHVTIEKFKQIVAQLGCATVLDAVELERRAVALNPAANSCYKLSDKMITSEKMSNEALKDNFQRHLAAKAAQQQYSSSRAKLVEAERDLMWESTARHGASALERRAAAVVRAVKEADRKDPSLFGNEASEAVPPSGSRDMGGQFLTNRDRIEKSQLYKIAHRMPKGAQLHIHFNSELEPGVLLKRAKSMDTMFIRSTRPLLIPDDLDETEVILNVLTADTMTSDIFSSNYNPDHRSSETSPWMKFRDFCTFLDTRFGHDGLKWVRAKCCLTEPDVYSKEQTLNGIWARFNQGTRCFKGLLGYESVFRWYIGEAINDMINDNIMYAELRPMLLDKSIPSDDGLSQLSHSDQMNIVVEEVAKKKEQLRKKNKLEKFPFGLKIIYCTPRSISKERMVSEMLDCIKLKQAFPDLICGFDLVGAEDRPNPINFYRDELLAFTSTCKDLGIEIPFLFHAGETLLDTGGTSDPDNSNLFDSVLLNAKRIGHGYSILKHPKLIEEFKKKRICIELCPVSNELLHLCRNIKEHPYPQMLAAGLECTVNSDNPALFRSSTAFSSSLSYEFYQVMVGSTSMTLHGWRQLIEWSIAHSCLSEAEKAQAFAFWRPQWEEFCWWVVKEFGAAASGTKG
ncbi:MAG: hypothetical protein M1820_004146 [Bogoriella megaspora]|nr:MAG: hypothetical protein M1820_004146 [Bogoriella megaspora]